MALLDTLGLSFGIGTWLLALLGGLIVAVVFSRFLDWALIIFASLLGSMIIVRSLMAWLMPSAVPGAVGTFLILVLTGVGIFFHYRQSHFKK